MVATIGHREGKVLAVDRNVLLLYLRDLRDLEFAKNRIDEMMRQERYNYETKKKQLAKMDFWNVEPMENPWTPMRIVLILLLGVLMIPFAYGLMFGEVTKKELYDEPRSALFWGKGIRYYSVPLWQDDVLRTIFIGAIVGLALLIGLVVLATLAQKHMYNRTVKNALTHNRDEGIRVARNQQEAEQLQTRWDEFIKSAQSEYKTVCSLLDKEYSLNIIPQQFRNLASIIYIYDYMSTSRESLSDTLLHGHIESGVQRILEKLDTIIHQNQAIIFQGRIAEAQNREIIDQNTRIIDSSRRIEENMRDAVYYQEIVANYSKANAYFALATYLQ